MRGPYHVIWYYRLRTKAKVTLYILSVRVVSSLNVQCGSIQIFKLRAASLCSWNWLDYLLETMKTDFIMMWLVLYGMHDFCS